MSEVESVRNQGAANNGLLASILSHLISVIGGRHDPSFKAGKRMGYDLGLKVGRQETAVAVREASREKKFAVVIEDMRDSEVQNVQYEKLLLDDARLNITPMQIKAFKADAAVRLGEDHQPTEEQWKAILAPSTSAATIGIAGTGKSYVMQLRAIFLHCYLDIPLEQMTILAVTKDCRLEMAMEITRLFAAWGVELTQEQGLRLVKTPRGVLLNMIREIGPLSDIVPFDLLGTINQGDEDGRPFDSRLTSEQLDVIERAYQKAYSQSTSFAESLRRLFATSIALPRPNTDNPMLVQYSEKGQAQLRNDEVIHRAVTSMWHAMGAWPVAGVEPTAVPINVMSNRLLTNGHIATVDAFIVLGFPRGGDKSFIRPGAETTLYEESLAKRAFIQRYAEQRVVWVESPEQLSNMLASLDALSTAAPNFPCRIKGLERPMTTAECLYQTGALIETLGLNPSKAISNLRFIPNDPDALFYDCAAKFWPMFETFLLEQTPRIMTFNRLFCLFGEQGPKNLRCVPTDALKSMRHVLTDELQDITVHTGEFIKACLAENRYRIEVEDVPDAVMSVFACGDDFQTAHGTQGATPKFLTEFREHFPSKGYERNLLGVNFRSQQGIIQAAHSLVLGIPSVSMFSPVSAAQDVESQPVEVYDLSAGTFMRLFDQHYGDGESILILAANPDDYAQSEQFINTVLERDKRDNPTRRVRVRAAQRSKGLEADTVFIIGDLVASTSTWAKNQIFRAAQTMPTDAQSPFDAIQQVELYRLAHISITRARKTCYWLIARDTTDGAGRLRASTRIANAVGTIIDHR